MNTSLVAVGVLGLVIGCGSKSDCSAVAAHLTDLDAKAGYVHRWSGGRQMTRDEENEQNSKYVCRSKFSAAVLECMSKAESPLAAEACRAGKKLASLSPPVAADGTFDDPDTKFHLKLAADFKRVEPTSLDSDTARYFRFERADKNAVTVFVTTPADPKFALSISRGFSLPTGAGNHETVVRRGDLDGGGQYWVTSNWGNTDIDGNWESYGIRAIASAANHDFICDANVTRKSSTRNEQIDSRALEASAQPLIAACTSLRVTATSAATGSAGAPEPPPGPAPIERLSVSTEGSFATASDAKVTIVEFDDYATSFGFKVQQTLADLRQKYGANVRIVHKDLIVHPAVATDAAFAACAAGQQGKFFEMANLIWHKAWTPELHVEALNADAMKEAAAQLRLDLDRFAADVSGDTCKKMIAADAAQAQALKFGGVPTFFINGRKIAGAQPLETFTKVIDEELATPGR